jgi:hypothetical protein
MPIDRFHLALLAPLLVACWVAGCGGTGASREGDSGAGTVFVHGSTVSNLPATTFNVTTTQDAADLELLSSNLVPDPNSRVNYIQWFGEVRNNGTTPACLVEIRINFITAEGFGVQAMSAYADGEIYQDASLDSLVPCIPPGKTGAFWDNDLPALPPDLSTVDVIEAELQLSARPNAVPAPSAPKLSAMSIGQDASRGAGFWALSGTLTATETIYNISIAGYYKDDNGLIVICAPATNLETVNAGASWKWKAMAYQGAKPASYLVFADYLQP